MSSVLAYLGLPVGGDLYSTLQTGQKSIQSNWDTFAMFGAVIVLVAAVIFTCLAVVKTRNTASWWWSAIVAWIVGAVLLTSKATSTIQGDFSDTWTKTFGGGLTLLWSMLSPWL